VACLYFHTLREILRRGAIYFQDEVNEVRVGELLDELVARAPGPEQPNDPGPSPEEPVTVPPTPETPGTGDPNLPPSDPDPDPIPGPDPAPPKGPGYSE
jgi:hypothetical protein